MAPLSDKQPARRGRGGFTFVEVLVASAIAALAITMAILSFQAITAYGGNSSPRLDVQLPGGTLANFYGMTNNFVSVSAAPDFSMAAPTAALRDRLDKDLASASVAFCLGRNGRSAYRPSTIPVPANPATARSLNSPAAMLAYLGTDAASGNFVSYQGASAATNASLFILTPSSNTNEAIVQAVYEMDLVPAVSPSGIYASVRRYVGGTNTDYFHVFYPNQTNNFRPVTAYFERSALPAEGNQAVDRFKRAEARPFYFVWWPDPLERFLESDEAAGPATGSQARDAYKNMRGRTSLFFVVPAFPAL